MEQMIYIMKTNIDAVKKDFWEYALKEGIAMIINLKV
jgi:hypothetical protein